MVVNYKAAGDRSDKGEKERLIIEPNPEDLDDTIFAIEAQILAASNLKNKWKNRFGRLKTNAVTQFNFISSCSTYELLPGYLRVFLGDDQQKVHEMDVDLTIATVEPIALPGKPHCLSIKPNIDARNTAIIMEAGSPAQQEAWFAAIRRETSREKSMK